MSKSPNSVPYFARPMYPLPNARTVVVEANPVLTEESVTRHVTSWANDSRAHALLTSWENSAKLVSQSKNFYVSRIIR